MSGKKLDVPIEPADAAEERARMMVTPADLARRIAEDKRLVLIDVRSEPEFRMMRIDGARLATRELVEEIFTRWEKDVPIVVYDHFGRESLNAARALASRGFTDARALAGGIDAWSEAVDPMIPRYG